MQLDGWGSPSQYFRSGYVEVLQFYGDIYDIESGKLLKNHVVTVVDRMWVVQKEPLGTSSGRPNIFHSGWRTRPDNLWAMGPLDNLVGMQYMLNHLENSRADAFDQMLAPTRVIIGDVEEEGVEAGIPGGTYRIPSGEGSVHNLTPDTVVLSADNKIRALMELMEDTAGAPRQEAGIRTPGEKTATEVTSLANASSRIFLHKTQQFERFLNKVLDAELETSRRNLNAPDLARTIDENGTQLFLEITREDLTSNGKIVAAGSRHFARQAKMTQQLQLLSNITASDPMIAQHFPSTRIAELLEESLDLEKTDLYSPYARVGEEAELMKLQAAAQTQIQAEQEVPVGDEGELTDEEIAEQNGEIGI